jgi:hypothetical protein
VEACPNCNRPTILRVISIVRARAQCGWVCEELCMATMDEAIPESKPASAPAVKAPPGEQRRHARDLLAAQQQKLGRLEDELSERLRQLSEGLSDELSQHVAVETATSAADARVAELEQQLDLLTGQAKDQAVSLDEARARVQQARVEREGLEQELRVRSALLAEAQRNDEARRVELATLREQAMDLQAQLALARSRQEELRAELAQQGEQCNAGQDELQASQRRLVRKFRRRQAELQERFDAQQSEAQAALDARRRELEDKFVARQSKLEAELEERLAEALGKMDVQRADDTNELSRKQARQVAALEEQAEQLRQLTTRQNERSDELDRREAELTARATKKDGDKSAKSKRLEAEIAELREELEQARAGADDAERSNSAGRALEARLTKLQGERDLLAKQLAESEANLAEASKAGDGRKREEMQRRLELAVEDLREARRANADLEAKLAKSRSEPKPSGAGSGGSMNWEAQKEKLLAALEADDRDDDDAVEERNTIEGTIRITDQIIAQKDQEIAELKRQIGATSDSARSEQQVAVADLLDHDETIRQEREKLAQVCAEWREKIGKAEIDISVERAKLARERMELEERMRTMQSEQARRPVGETTEEILKPARGGRWLARLGLKDLDEK